MFRKLSVFIVLIALLSTANCAFCGANGEDAGSGSDEVLVMKKDTPTAVTAPASVTVSAAVNVTASPLAVTSAAVPVVTAAPAVTKTAKPAGKKHVKKSKIPVVKVPTAVAAKMTPEQLTPEQQKINTLVAQVKNKQTGRKGMLCDIVIKTSYAGASAGAQEVKGRVGIKKKDKFRVHYTEPTEQFLISNSKTMWVYTPGLKQVIKQAAKDAALDTNFYIEIENSIEYFVNNSKTTLEETDTEYILTMIPKDRKKLDFEEIKVKILKADLVPEYMSMKYDGSVSEVTFSNVKNYTAEEAALVEELSDKNFEFKTPDGVEEIEASALIDAATE